MSDVEKALWAVTEDLHQMTDFLMREFAEAASAKDRPIEKGHVAEMLATLDGVYETLGSPTTLDVVDKHWLACELRNAILQISLVANSLLKVSNATKTTAATDSRRDKRDVKNEIIQRLAQEFRSKPANRKKLRDGSTATAIRDGVNSELEARGIPKLGVDAIASRLARLETMAQKPTDDRT